MRHPPAGYAVVMEPTLSDEIVPFFEAYARARQDLDPAAGAALWGTPGMILTEDFAGALHTREQIAQALAGSAPAYRALGMTRVEFTLLDVSPVTASIVRVGVRWRFYAGEEHLVDVDHEYVLRRDPDGLHAYVALVRDENDALAALAARKGLLP